MKSEYLSYEIKTLRYGCALARKEDVANATVLGARVSQAKLFVLSEEKLVYLLVEQKKKMWHNIKVLIMEKEVR